MTLASGPTSKCSEVIEMPKNLASWVEKAQQRNLKSVRFLFSDLVRTLPSAVKHSDYR